VLYLNNKLETITNLFEGKEIRSIWDSEKEEYYFSVVDVISALTESKDASDYWTTLKRRLTSDEGSELPTNCRSLKFKAKDGKMRKTDTLDIKGILTKNNYLIHTDAIKNYILPDNDFYKDRQWLKYAGEADVLNVILFSTTAKKWRELNPDLAKNSNIRDYASINELTVLSNLESHNAELIKEGKDKEERFEILSEIAKYQLDILNNAEKIKLLGDKNDDGK